jgi:RND family efflux transporter MFP subunit
MCSHSQARRNSAARIARTVAALAVVTAMTAPAAGAEERSFDCVIDPSEMAKLGSPVAGILSKVLVQRGDLVTKDQEVAQLESSVEAAAVAYNRFRAVGTAKIDAQQQRLELAKSRMGRADELIGRKLVTPDKYDELHADLGVAQQDLLSAQQEQQLAQLDLDRAEATLDQRTIRSPIDGIITEKKLSAGEFVNQEGYVVAVARLDPLHVETYLPVSTYGHVSVGASAQVRPDPPIGGSYGAEVIVVDRVFDPSSSTYGVRLALPNPDRMLPGGQRCKVAFDMPAAPKPPGE